MSSRSSKRPAVNFLLRRRNFNKKNPQTRPSRLSTKHAHGIAKVFSKKHETVICELVSARTAKSPRRLISILPRCPPRTLASWRASSRTASRLTSDRPFLTNSSSPWLRIVTAWNCSPITLPLAAIWSSFVTGSNTTPTAGVRLTDRKKGTKPI